MLTKDKISWDLFSGRYQELLNEELSNDADHWLLKWSELAADIQEMDANVKRAQDENTNDRNAQESYAQFFNEVMPKIEKHDQLLRNKLLNLKNWQPKPENVLFIRKMRAQSDVYREENLPLLAKIADLEAEYQKITGEVTVRLDDQELTIPQVKKLQLESDRNLREKSWRAMVNAELSYTQSIDRLTLELLKLRYQLAKNAGFENFRDYLWQEQGRFDYMPKDCQTFIDSVKVKVIPLVNKLMEKQQKMLNVDTLRPWDTQVDAHSPNPLQPFKTSTELEEKTTKIFHQLDKELADYFNKMRGFNDERRFLDLESRKNKALGAYCNFFPRSNRAYIFMNTVGTPRDVDTMFHEAGHAFHFMISGDKQELYWNCDAPSEFAEVASMAMELLVMDYLKDNDFGFYSKEEYNRFKYSYLRSIVSMLIQIASGYDFQNWLYTQNPNNLTIDDIDQKWFNRLQEFESIIDYSGLKNEMKKRWQNVMHTYTHPLYYISYGFAQIGALQIWQNSMKNKDEALKKYKESLALGGTQSLPELYQAAGAKFAFDQETIGEIVSFLDREIEKVSG